MINQKRGIGKGFIGPIFNRPSMKREEESRVGLVQENGKLPEKIHHLHDKSRREKHLPDTRSANRAGPLLSPRKASVALRQDRQTRPENGWTGTNHQSSR